MKIRARIFKVFEVIIIDFVSAYQRDVEAVYIDDAGKVGSCPIDHVEILDEDYIPSKN